MGGFEIVGVLVGHPICRGVGGAPYFVLQKEANLSKERAAFPSH